MYKNVSHSLGLALNRTYKICCAILPHYLEGILNMGNLVIGRRVGESVYLSFGEVAVRVVIARAGAVVKLAIEAPLSVVITRGEFLGVGADAAMAARVVTDCNKRGRA